VRKNGSVLLIDSRQPMSFTSAQSGDNYRNWWPHRTMTAFTNDSIDELDRLAAESDNVFNLTRGGYCLATRQSSVEDAIATIPGDINVDVLADSENIRKSFPALSTDIQNVIHIRRGGDISGQQLGQYLLQKFSAAGGKRLLGDVIQIDNENAYELTVDSDGESRTINADVIVTAAGPFCEWYRRDVGPRITGEEYLSAKDRLRRSSGRDPTRHAILDRSRCQAIELVG